MRCAVMAVDPPIDRLEEEIAGLDALDALRSEERQPRLPRLWAGTWPKLLAVAGFLVMWQLIVWTGWKTEEALPGPRTALAELSNMVLTVRFWDAVATTMRR